MPMQPDDLTRRNDVAALQHLRKLREPFTALNTRIVTGIVNRVGLATITPPCHVVEIGAGDGQLKNWLPDNLSRYLIQTEPSPSSYEQLVQRCPENQCIIADVYDLPFPDGSVDAVLALGSYDALDQQQQARNEITRVLKPGGLFIHFLDMATQLESLFQQMHGSGELPLPNFLAPSVVTQLVDADKAATLPATEPLDDLVITRQAEFVELVAMFIEAGHPLAKDLAPYLSLFDRHTFNASTTANAFISLLADDQKMQRLNCALLAIYLALNETDTPDQPHDKSQNKAQGTETSTLPFTITFSASWKFLRGQLESHFAPEHGYEIDLSRIVAARQPERRNETIAPRIKYIARCVGQTFRHTAIPAALQGTAIDTLDGCEPDLSTWREPNENEYVLESGMYVFAARKQQLHFN
jgi:SAM-dependent methyltransferase